MSSDEPPAEPTPTTRTWKLHISAWRCLAIFLVVAVTIFVLTYQHGVIWFPGYTANQWAAAGGWVSGIGALAAVAVAIYQSHVAMKSAEQARTDAKDLLATELDEQRRMRQIEVILPIWPAVADIRQWYYDEYRQAVTNHHAAITSGDSTRFSEGLRAVDRLDGEWKELQTRLDLLFEPALLLTIQPNVAAHLESVYSDFFTLGDEIRATLHGVRQWTPPETKTTDALIKKLAVSRQIMLQVVRHHLTQGPPITFRSYEDLRAGRGGDSDPPVFRPRTTQTDEGATQPLTS